MIRYISPILLMLSLPALANVQLTEDYPSESPNYSMVETPLNDTIDMVSIGGGYMVTIVEGPPNVTLAGESQALHTVSIQTEKNIITISPNNLNNNWFTKLFDWRVQDNYSHNILVTISLPKLKTLEVRDTASVTLSSPFHPDLIDLSGGSKLDATSPLTNIRSIQIEMRGVSKFTATNLITESLLINQSAMSSFYALSINSARQTKINLYNRAMHQVLELKTNDLDMSLNTQSRADLGAITAPAGMHAALYASSELNIQKLIAGTLFLELASASNVEIQSGSAKKSILTLYGSSQASMGTFDTGDLSQNVLGNSKISYP